MTQVPKSAARRLGSCDGGLDYFVCVNEHLHGTCWLVPLSSDENDVDEDDDASGDEDDEDDDGTRKKDEDNGAGDLDLGGMESLNKTTCDDPEESKRKRRQQPPKTSYLATMHQLPSSQADPRFHGRLWLQLREM